MYYFYNQNGAGLNPDKIWGKYKVKLIEKLSVDDSFLRIKKSLSFIELPEDFIKCDITNQKYTYLEWIITSYLNNGIVNYEDLLLKTKPALEDFELLKTKGLLNKGDGKW